MCMRKKRIYGRKRLFSLDLATASLPFIPKSNTSIKNEPHTYFGKDRPGICVYAVRISISPSTGPSTENRARLGNTTCCVFRFCNGGSVGVGDRLRLSGWLTAEVPFPVPAPYHASLPLGLMGVISKAARTECARCEWGE